jgi:hypothetical protein
MGWLKDLLGSNEKGQRYTTEDGATYTSNKADDPKAEGGRYISVTNTDGEKRTVVSNSDGNVVKDTGWSKK